MKKMILICGMGILLSGCTTTTIQTRTVYSPAYPQYSAAHASPYVYQPRYYPRCYTTYHRGYYGLQARRVCH